MVLFEAGDTNFQEAGGGEMIFGHKPRGELSLNDNFIIMLFLQKKAKEKKKWK